MCAKDWVWYLHAFELMGLNLNWKNTDLTLARYITDLQRTQTIKVWDQVFRQGTLKRSVPFAMWILRRKEVGQNLEKAGADILILIESWWNDSFLNSVLGTMTYNSYAVINIGQLIAFPKIFLSEIIMLYLPMISKGYSYWKCLESGNTQVVINFPSLYVRKLA